MARNRPLHQLSDDEITDMVKGFMPVVSPIALQNYVRILRAVCNAHSVLILQAETDDFRAIVGKPSVNWYV